VAHKHLPGLVDRQGVGVMTIEEAAPVTPYQARLYGAVIHGYDRGRRRTERMVRVLWQSRRRWQLEAETERKQAAQVLVRVRVAEAILEASGDTVRTDLVRFALDPTVECPADWVETLIVLRDQLAA